MASSSAWGAGESSWLRKGATTPAGCAPPPASKVGGGDIAAEAWSLLLSEKGTLGAVPQFRYDLIDFARQALELNFSTQKNLFQQQATQNNASVTVDASGCSIWDVIWDVICLAKQMLQHD